MCLPRHATQSPRTDSIVHEPRMVKHIEPVYPPLAHAVGKEGSVWLKYFVNKNGAVSDVSVERSTDIIFNGPAIAAMKRCTFVPAHTASGHAVECRGVQEVQFHLTKKKSGGE